MSDDAIKVREVNDVALVVREVTYPCVPWKVEGDQKIQPVRGTWTLAPIGYWEKGMHGVLSCANCGKPALLPHDLGEAMPRGVRKLKQLGCSCGFVCDALLEDWDLRKLYCIVWETYDTGGKVIPQKDYMHAVSREETLYLFEQSHLGIRYRIVDAAPVVGYFAKSEKDDKHLTV